MKVFTIAEIGINHNGDLGLAKELINIASDVGFDAVKFQKRDPDVCVPEDQKDTMRDTVWGRMRYIDYKKKIEFGKKEFNDINNHCTERGIDWFASSWDVGSQHFLEEYNLKYNKVASAMLTNKDLLQTIAKEGKHTFVSTGMSTVDEIKIAVKIFEENNCKYTLFATTSSYPCPIDECNVNMVRELKKFFPNSSGVGYSNHSPGILAPTIAVAIGAEYIEVHITKSRYMYGTDQGASIEKRGMEVLIRDINNVDKILGDGEIRVYNSEMLARKKLRGGQ